MYSSSLFLNSMGSTETRYSVDQTIVDQFHTNRCGEAPRENGLNDHGKFQAELQRSMREATERALSCNQLADATTLPEDLTAEERRTLIHTLQTLYLYFTFTSADLKELQKLSPTITRAALNSGYCGARDGRRYPHVFTFHSEAPLPNRNFAIGILMYDKGGHSYECTDGNTLA